MPKGTRHSQGFRASQKQYAKAKVVKALQAA